MEPTLDQVRQELAEIHEQLLSEQLLSLQADAFSRRSDLKEPQNELRQPS